MTLTGPGGIGRTRLAVETAERLGPRFRDGVAFVPLEGLDSAELVAPTIAAALGLRGSGADPVGGVVAFLRPRRLDHVLDNFEHVISAATVVAALLERTGARGARDEPPAAAPSGWTTSFRRPRSRRRTRRWRSSRSARAPRSTRSS